MKDEQLKWLFNNAKIKATVTKYTTSVDKHNWNDLQSVFTTDIERDYSAFTESPLEHIKSKQHITECQLTLPGFDSTQHFLLNNEITINGDKATADFYMIAEHTLFVDGVKDQFIIHGVYTFQLSQINDEWKINGIKLKVNSTLGNQGLFEVAGKRASEKA